MPASQGQALGRLQKTAGAFAVFFEIHASPALLVRAQSGARSTMLLLSEWTAPKRLAACGPQGVDRNHTRLEWIWAEARKTQDSERTGTAPARQKKNPRASARGSKVRRDRCLGQTVPERRGIALQREIGRAS